jgi:WhiB family redox-sensing transcriptional regulator
MTNTNRQDDDAWRDDALCQQVGWEPFFPPKGGRSNAAKAICASCPVQAECLEYAVTSFQRHGIWGGKSETDFRRIRKERGLAEPPAVEARAAVTAEEARHLLAFGMGLPAVAKQLGVSEGWVRQLLGSGKRAAA